MTVLSAASSELEQAVLDTFEEMAFADPMPAADAVFDWDASGLMWARIATIEPQAGEIALLAEPVVARELAGAVLGEDARSDRAVRDVLAELVHVIAGGWLMRLQPGGLPAQLALPESGARRWDESDREWAFSVYELGDERFAIAVAAAGTTR